MSTQSPTGYGPVMVDVEGIALTAEERETLRHPLVGGVILFSRNYASPEQLRQLCEEMHGLRNPAIMIAVDHEGGRVQRFRQGLTRLPAMRALGVLWDQDRPCACAAAEATGYVLAAELLSLGVDLSFAPVLDLDYGPSTVIGDRAFHRDPRAVVALADALVSGMASAGMRSVGKHFPGHGFVSADSHIAVPVDNRPYEAIAADDLVPYEALGAKLGGVMPAHVIFDQVDTKPAGFSAHWLETVLRQRLAFDGVIFSDDLSMEGASVAGGITDRAQAALAAGCDMVLVCNAGNAARALLERWRPTPKPESARRLARLMPDRAKLSALVSNPSYADARERMSAIPAL